jgi:glycosyltransferase involved in cell wall biosynthesis
MTHSVSVVIPTYNRSGHLKACVESLLAAGVPDIEVVVADDGSTDDTEEVTRRFGEPVRYVRQQNAGPAAARNRGAAISQGRYLTFLDSDDSWRPGIASRLVAQLDRHPGVSLAFADTSMGNPVDGYASFIGTYGAEWFHALPARTLEPGLRQLERWPFLRRLSRRNVMFLGSLLVRRETFERVGGFDPALRGAADWEFFMRVVVAEPVAFSEGEPLALYEKHAEGMSTDSDHMEKDFALALEAVARKCELPPDMRQHVQGRLREQLFGWAWQAYDRGDVPVARERLRWALRSGGGFRERAYLMATYLPRGLLSILRGVKSSLRR